MIKVTGGAALDHFAKADRLKAIPTFKAAVLARKRAGEQCSNDILAYEVFLAWKVANEDPLHEFKHGRNSGAKPPDPDADQPYARLFRYLDGRQGQKLSGWKICAEILGCDLADLLDGKPKYHEMDTERAKQRRRIFAGSSAIDSLANMEVSEPRSIDGRNRADLDGIDRQQISLDLRLIFNSRTDLWEDEQGSQRYTCQIVLTQARVDVELEKQGAFLLDGIALDGKTDTKSLSISYLGSLPENRGLSWKITPRVGKMLDGVSDLIYQFCDLDGSFTKSDKISIMAEPHWISIFKIESEEGISAEEEGQVAEIKRHIRRQILNRVLQSSLGSRSRDSSSRWILAQREFMIGVEDED